MNLEDYEIELGIADRHSEAILALFDKMFEVRECKKELKLVKRVEMDRVRKRYDKREIIMERDIKSFESALRQFLGLRGYWKVLRKVTARKKEEEKAKKAKEVEVKARSEMKPEGEPEKAKSLNS